MLILLLMLKECVAKRSPDALDALGAPASPSNP